MKRANRKALYALNKLFKYANEKGKPFMGFTPEENADVGQVILDLVFYGWGTTYHEKVAKLCEKQGFKITKGLWINSNGPMYTIDFPVKENKE